MKLWKRGPKRNCHSIWYSVSQRHLRLKMSLSVILEDRISFPFFPWEVETIFNDSWQIRIRSQSHSEWWSCFIFVPALPSDPYYDQPYFCYFSRSSLGVYSIFRSENDIYSPSSPSEIIFFPLSRYVIFWLLSWPFCLNSSLFCIYFTILFPFF